MKNVLRVFHLNFIPRSPDFALLILRVWLGVSLLSLHGWGKLSRFGAMAPKFSDPLGVGSSVSLSMAVLAEVVCAALVALGLLTRFAALVVIILLAVAFTMVHGGKLSGPGNGEMAFVYLAGFVTIFFAGPGRFSLDAKAGGAA